MTAAAGCGVPGDDAICEAPGEIVEEDFDGGGSGGGVIIGGEDDGGGDVGGVGVQGGDSGGIIGGEEEFEESVGCEDCKEEDDEDGRGRKPGPRGPVVGLSGLVAGSFRLHGFCFGLRVQLLRTLITCAGRV